MRASGSTSSSRQAASGCAPAGPGRRRPAPQDRRGGSPQKTWLTRPPWQEGQLEYGCGEAQGQERAPGHSRQEAPAEARRHELGVVEGVADGQVAVRAMATSSRHRSPSATRGPIWVGAGGGAPAWPRVAGGSRPAWAGSALAYRPPPRQTGPPGRST